MDHELTAKWHELDKVRVDLKEVAVLRPDLRVADGYIQYSTDGGSTWQNIIAVAELKGGPGVPGKDGSDATVTAANIAGALGYTPAAPGDIPVVPTAEISANTAARHAHANKGVLDGITAAKTAAWDAKVSPAALGPAVNTALQAAKDSGAFRGDKGDPGAKGDPGKTPVRGTDYWTAADKQEIVNSVIAALPDGTEVSY